MGDHLFLDVRPVDSGIGVGRRELNLGHSDVDRGADTVFDKVQVTDRLDDFGFVRGSVVVTLAFGRHNDAVELPGHVQQTEFEFGGESVVGLVHLHERNLGQVVFGVVKIEVFQLETEAVGQISGVGRRGFAGDLVAAVHHVGFDDASDLQGDVVVHVVGFSGGYVLGYGVLNEITKRKKEKLFLVLKLDFDCCFYIKTKCL